MADLTNSKRRLPDFHGKIFIPLPFQLAVTEEAFISGKKILFLIIIAVVGLLGGGLISEQYEWPGYLKTIAGIILFLVIFVMFRYLILEESYYQNLYKRMQKQSLTEPNIFWNIASITKSPQGTFVTFSDLRVGVFVRLYRSTVAGQPIGKRENHFDAVSDFFKFLNQGGYGYVQLDIMESAVKDKRLSGLEELIDKPDNAPLKQLMEVNISYITNVSRVTLAQSEYYLIWGKRENGEVLMDDVYKALSIIKDGAYSGYDILNAYDIAELFKDLYGISYFDAEKASLKVFGESKFTALKIIKDHKKDGTVIDLEKTVQRAVKHKNKTPENIDGSDIPDDTVFDFNDKK
ncbi:hypothetical protein AGMMS49975_24710 [Clostridia bacterium]|nr:hypothetical protein AGMMS49975_24710 [Clostridia bacterium]